jgi:phenylacetate-coenzyme A ligase PaaK-like adenylate-forming protein
MVGNHGMGRSLGAGGIQGQGTQVEPRESALVELFRRGSQLGAGYQAFLRGRGVDPAAVRTAAEVRSLPVLTKDNYLRVYPLPALVPRRPAGRG